MSESAPASALLTEPMVREALRLVNDPEVDCNIVDLGLVYDIRIEGPKIFIRMTLTTQGCPMHESIAWGVQNALLQLEGVADAQVEIVWDPPWHPSMISEYGRMRLGMGE